MVSKRDNGRRAQEWTALALCAAVVATWVPALFYGSWFLWAIAAAAATRSYQLRSAALRMSSPA